MKSNFMMVLLLATFILTATGQPYQYDKANARFEEETSFKSTTGGLGILSQIGQKHESLLNAAVAALAPLIGRVIRRVQIIGAASNTVTGTINNGIVNGFAIPIEHDYNYHYEDHHHHHYDENSDERKDTLTEKKKPQHGKPSSKRKSKNHL